jgi:hypothetical protein
VDEFDKPQKCPTCNGTGQVTLTEESKRRFLESLDHWARLRETSNAKLAGMVSEIENYLRLRDLSPLVHQFLQEVWWRLQTADEPIEDTRRKIQTLSDDPKWLAKE